MMFSITMSYGFGLGVSDLTGNQTDLKDLKDTGNNVFSVMVHSFP